MSTKITTQDVAKIAVLANLPITPDQEKTFADQFSSTIEVIDELNKIDTSDTPPVSFITKLTNVTRPDVIDKERVFSQAEALSNAKNTYKGFFVVKQVIQK